jgi:hypothetical protein
MAISGRKPKPEGQAIHRNKLAHDWTEVPNVPFRGGPKLPARRMNGRSWEPRIRAKWKAWSSMPHCKLWGPSAWEFALDTIELAALVYDGEPRFAAELRAREKTLGTTPESLRDLRIRYTDADKAAAPARRASGSKSKVAQIDDYRDL